MAAPNSSNGAGGKKAPRLLYAISPEYRLNLKPAGRSPRLVQERPGDPIVAREGDSLWAKFSKFWITVKGPVSEGRTTYLVEKDRACGLLNYDEKISQLVADGVLREEEREEIYERLTRRPEFGREFGTKKQVQTLEWGSWPVEQGTKRVTVDTTLTRGADEMRGRKAEASLGG